MNPGFHLDCRHSAGNLHVNLCGEFNGMCAWELFKVLTRHQGAGRIFVNTQKIRRIAEEGINLFKSHMSHRCARDWLYFKGQKGFEIAPNGSRVLICKKAARELEDKSDRLEQPFRIAINLSTNREG